MHHGNGFCYQHHLANAGTLQATDVYTEGKLLDEAWIVHCGSTLVANGGQSSNNRVNGAQNDAATSSESGPDEQCTFACAECRVCQDSGHTRMDKGHLGECKEGTHVDTSAKGNWWCVPD